MSRHPLPLSINVQNLLPIDLGRPISSGAPPISSPNYNQSIKREHNLRMTIILSGPSFRSAFIFSINSLILSDFPLTSFQFAEASLSAFLWVYTQCYDIIKGWLHCLMPKSKRRFLVKNILMLGSEWCLVMAQFSLIKKNKDWSSRTLANSPITSHMCITPNKILKFPFFKFFSDT